MPNEPIAVCTRCARPRGLGRERCHAPGGVDCLTAQRNGWRKRALVAEARIAELEANWEAALAFLRQCQGATVSGVLRCLEDGDHLIKEQADAE